MSSTTPLISRVEVRRCVFPLARPLVSSDKTVNQPEYLFLRVFDTFGAEGHAFALADAPRTDLVLTELIAPRCTAVNIEDPVGAQRILLRRLQPHAAEGVVGRALSLLDIALWDLRGKREATPVHRLLGARRQTAPAMIVEDPADHEPDEVFVDRMVARASAGYRWLKIAYRAVDPRRFTRRLEAVMNALPPDVAVIVDAAWLWYDLELARRLLHQWNGLGLAWIEDLVPADDLPQLQALRKVCKAPLGLGDGVSRAETLMALARSGLADVIRVDATRAGGFTRFSDIAQAASHLMISTRMHPGIHLHAALGLTNRGPVEMSPDAPTRDASWEIATRARTTLIDGVQVVVGAQTPGLGLELDYELIEAHTVRFSQRIVHRIG